MIYWLEHRHDNQNEHRNYDKIFSHYSVKKRNNDYVFESGNEKGDKK